MILVNFWLEMQVYGVAHLTAACSRTYCTYRSKTSATSMRQAVHAIFWRDRMISACVFKALI